MVGSQAYEYVITDRTTLMVVTLPWLWQRRERLLCTAVPLLSFACALELSRRWPHLPANPHLLQAAFARFGLGCNTELGHAPPELIPALQRLHWSLVGFPESLDVSTC